MEYVEVARASSERGEVVLRRRHDPDAPAEPTVLELRVNGVFVMDNCETSSETALAQTALALVEEPHRVLVGGLGLGYTVREVLSDRRVEQVVVAEIEEALVRWFREGVVEHGLPRLADDRVSLVPADVRQVVAESTPASFDLVLLDVDNGPDFLVHEDNAAIYQREFLTQVQAALSPGGAIAVWSSIRSRALEDRLAEVFGEPITHECPVELQGREESYWLHGARSTPTDSTPTDDPRGER